jgi:GT2 family glycosyltransferase
VTAEQPLVSVVMPVRNEEAAITRAVESVLEQTVQDLQVLVVDGMSTDGTRAKLAELVRREPRIRVLDNPYRTIPHALNIGLRHAAGQFLARVDAHAEVNDAYLEIGLRELDGAQDVAAVGGQRRGVAGTPAGRAVAAALSSPFGVGDSINHYATEAQDTDHASFGVYRTEVLRAVGGWDENLLVNEDVDLDHRILAAGHRIRYSPEMTILWHVRESLPDFARQYRRYGRGKAAMVRKNGRGAVRLRHLAAPALVGALGGAGALAVAGRPRLATVLAAPYAAALTVTSTATARRSGAADVTAGRLAAAFATMHLSWGLGFLEGVVLAKAPTPASAKDPSVVRPGGAAPLAGAVR